MVATILVLVGVFFAWTVAPREVLISSAFFNLMMGTLLVTMLRPAPALIVGLLHIAGDVLSSIVFLIFEEEGRFLTMFIGLWMLAALFHGMAQYVKHKVRESNAKKWWKSS